MRIRMPLKAIFVDALPASMVFVGEESFFIGDP